MTTNNRTNDPTPEQVEAAAKAMHGTGNPWFAAYGDWGAAGFEIKKAFRDSARAALVAAQGAAPQAESADCDRDRIGICKRCGMGWDTRKVLDGDFACPVPPSSAESPVEPFKTWFACWWKNEPNAIAESNAQSAFYAGWDARGLSG